MPTPEYETSTYDIFDKPLRYARLKAIARCEFPATCSSLRTQSTVAGCDTSTSVETL